MYSGKTRQSKLFTSWVYFVLFTIIRVRIPLRTSHKWTVYKVICTHHSLFYCTVNILGPAYKEFGYNEQTLCIEIIESNVKMFSYCEHPLTASSFLRIYFFVLSRTQSNYNLTLGPAYNEFCYYEHSLIESSFLRTYLFFLSGNLCILRV